MVLKENVPLSSLTTMRLGGAADFVIDVETPEDCLEAHEFAIEKSLPIFYLGLGANSIGLDKGFRGVIIRNRLKGFKVLKETNDELLVESAGGEIWDDFVEFVTSKGFSGIEALSKIPSTVAAAPVQNIGAYGQEVSDTLVSVSAFDSLLGEFVDLPAKSLGFAYRKSIFNSGALKGRYFILSCTFHFTRRSLTPPFYNSLQTYLDEHHISDVSPASIRSAVSAIRAEKLPDPATTASAGSFFKNILLSSAEAKLAREKGIPLRETDSGEFKVNTGWLLENAGLKGKLFHGFEVSKKAALVLINRSAKREADLELAKQEISAVVKEKFGLTLEQEPVFICEEQGEEGNV